MKQSEEGGGKKRRHKQRRSEEVRIEALFDGTGRRRKRE